MTSLLHDIISNASGKWPDNTAVIEAGNPPQSINYKQLDKKIQSLSNQLLVKGLKKGERVGLLSKNSITFISVYFAISRAGGVAVPFNHTLDPSNIVKQANDCQISAIYIAKEFSKESKSIADKIKSIKFIIDENSNKFQPNNFPFITEDNLVSIIYTSGTTNNPLGVMLSHKNLVSNNKSIVKYTKITHNDKICCVLPFYYIYGLSLLLSHFLVGATVILDNRFMYPNIVLDSIEEHKATSFAGVSSHYAILLYKSDFKKRKLSSVRYFMQAGDKMPQGITKQLAKIFPEKELYIMYGQTETSPRLTYLDPALVEKKPNSVGKAIPGVTIKVVDGKGKECKTGQTGEIIAKGENIMRGYWNNEKETAKILRTEWIYTGDMGFKDSDGDLFIVGRKKDFVKVGANRVNPADVEKVVLEDDEIMEAAAVGVPDVILGEKIKLFIALVPLAKTSKDEIMKRCRDKLPSYKVPSEIIIVKTMPKNSYGKINKERLIAI